jgi:RNase P/RNase MRP subunit p30
MHNYLLFPYDEKAEQLSRQLGFDKTLFLGRDLELVSGTPKEILRKASSVRNKQLIYLAADEKTLRFVLEKTPVKIVLGMEKMYSRDRTHFPKSGLDQILCRIAADKEKTIGFSLSEVLNSRNPSFLLRRMSFNLNLCKKYKVPFVVGNFSRNKAEMRSAKDLEAFRRMLEKKKK